MTSSEDVATCGAITYVITAVSLPSNDVYSLNGLAVEGVAIDDQNWVTTATFKVTGQLGAYDTYDSNTVSVTIVNPCTGTDITVTSFTSTSLSTTILGIGIGLPFPEATDSIDEGISNYGDNLCGLYDYKVVAQDGSAITWLTVTDTRASGAADTRLLTLAPVVNDPVGVQTVRLFAKFKGAASYDANDYFEFTVTIGACVPTISTTDLNPLTQVYRVGDASQNIAFVPFTFAPACDYTFTYTAFLVADDASTSAITGIPVTVTDLTAATN